jgi:hypothetical protein
MPRSSNGVARRACGYAWPVQRCVICGIEWCLCAAHLDGDTTNNASENLAWLCWTHHWLYECGIYPLGVIRTMRKRWQKLDPAVLKPIWGKK